MGFGGLLAFSCGPLVTGVAVVWGTAQACSRRGVIVNVAAVALGLALLAGVFSPFGQAVTAWWID